MFESAELAHKLKKSVYKKEAPILRQALLAVQYELLSRAEFPVIILVNGVDGAGKGETVNLLNEWMDPRHIRTEAFGPLTDAESCYPKMWRFWQALPPKGKIGIFFGSWYTDPILQRVMNHSRKVELEHRVEQIRHFERMLVAEGALVLKLWFHLSKQTQKKRLKELSSNPETAWRVTKLDWDHHKNFDKFVSVCELVLQETSTAEAPWHIIDGSDAEYRSLTAGRLFLEALAQRLKKHDSHTVFAMPIKSALDQRTILNRLDYSKKLSRNAYEHKLEKYSGRLNLLTRHKHMLDRGLVVVFEGMDAAGKGSAIRRVTRALDARYYHVIPVAAPTDEEREQPYLWRFWRHVPHKGSAVIFDRSWYGRLLVERVEKLCPKMDWMRGYHEINDFEEQLVEQGIVVVKFWLSITKEEQLVRFRAREKIAYKQFKITEEDWRNRRKWSLYEHAICDMVDRTSTHSAPWHIIPANDKLYARIEILKYLGDAIEKAL